MRLSESVLCLALTATGASAFSLAPSALPRSHVGLRTAACAVQHEAPESNTRRALVAGLISLPLAGVLPAQALKYDPNDGKAREAYIEDTATIKKARYGKQPTRTDVERNVKKIVMIREVMDEANKAKDAEGIAKAIGDLSIEASKKNANLGKDIPKINIAKSYMYAYAGCFSKGYDSPLTIDMKEAADAYYVAMSAASEAAKTGDTKGAKEALKTASEALNKYAGVVEAETLGGRLNSIRVSVKGLVDANAEGVIDSYKENKRVQKETKSAGFL